MTIVPCLRLQVTIATTALCFTKYLSNPQELRITHLELEADSLGILGQTGNLGKAASNKELITTSPQDYPEIHFPRQQTIHVCSFFL